MASLDVAMQALDDQANSMGFVEFTKGLLSGVYDVVVDAQMEQLESYAELLESVSGTAADYLTRTSGLIDTGSSSVTDNTPRLEEYIDDVLGLPGPFPSRISLDPQKFADVDAHFSGQLTKDAGAGSKVTLPAGNTDGDITANHLKLLIFEKVKSEAEKQRQFLLNLLSMGYARIDTKHGCVETGIHFQISSIDSEAKAQRDTDIKSNSWYAKGSAFGAFSKWGFRVDGGYASSRLQVSTFSKSELSSVQMNASMTGNVKVEFGTSTFPTVALTQ